MEDAPYQPSGGFVPMPTQAPINAYVGVARSKKHKAKGEIIPEHVPLGSIVNEPRRNGQVKRKNDKHQLFRQSHLQKRHRPATDVVEIEAEAGATGDARRRFCGVSRDALPGSSSFITIAKRGLLPVRLPYPENQKSFVSGASVIFQGSTASKDNHGTLAPRPALSPADELVGTLLSCVPGQDLYVHLHPISKKSLAAFCSAVASKETTFSGAISDDAAVPADPGDSATIHAWASAIAAAP